MLQRTAEHLYWMGRYLERAENSARAVENVAQQAILPDQDASAWDGLLAMAGLKDEFRERYHAPSTADLLHYLLFDPDNPSSLLSSIKAARENGRAACSTLSPDAWESLNGLWLDLNELDQYHLLSGGVAPCLARVKEGARSVRGALEAARVQEEAANVLTLGTMLERADYLVRLLRERTPVLLSAAEHDGADDSACMALLQAAGAIESYRAVYRDAITPRRVIEWLVLRPGPACSLRACIDRIADCLAAGDDGGREEATRLALELRGLLRDEGTAATLRQALPEHLTGFAASLRRLGDDINQDLRTPLCA